MAVQKPLKIILTNWDEGRTDTLTMENHPDHPEMGSREVSFGRELYIEADDFMEDPPKKFFRLRPEGEVRLKGAYIIRCDEVIKNADARHQPPALLCRPGQPFRQPGAERKVKGTLHWVNAKECVPLTFRLYEPLLNDDNGDGRNR